MNPYSVLLLDIDGVLLDSGGQVSRNTKKLLNRLERRGVPVVLCSSGTPGAADSAARQCALECPLVCYGGSLILDERHDILSDSGIDGATAVELKRYAARAFPEIAVTSYLYEIWLADSAQNPNVRMAAARYGYEALEGALENALRSNGHAHKMLCVGPPSQLKNLRDCAAPLFPSLSMTVSGASYLEITETGASKCAAMERLRQHYNVAAEQVVVAGDDSEMLRRAGLGIAMGNAPEAVRRAAARVTASNDEEGLYIALKNLRFHPPGR